MKLKYFVQYVLLFFAALFFALPIASAENFSAQEARIWANNKGQQILNIMTSINPEEKIKRLDEILYNDVDLDYAAQFAAGKYWRKMSAQQQAQYSSLFKQYTAALYKNYPLNLDKGEVTYTIDNVITQKESQFVHCTIFIKALEQKVNDASKGGIKVVFRLVKNNGKIQLRDLQIAESSFLRAYRERFYKMIYEDDDEEIDWFLEDLKQLIADMEKENTN